MENIYGKVLGLSDKADFFWQSISFRNNPFGIIDIIIVAVLFYWIYTFLKETRALKILYGLLILLLILFIARLFNLTALNLILKYFLAMLVVAIPIVFQPELRAALEKLGRAKFILPETYFLHQIEIEKTIDKIIKAVEILSNEKRGALIVIGRQTGLRDFIETGINLQAKLSTELLLNIFSNKTPLHDGATIIIGERILAANCMLPLTESRLGPAVGTRHRAAIGLSAQTDALVIVVSEENGQISLAVNGNLSRKLTPERVKEILIKLLKPQNKKTKHVKVSH